MEFKEFCKQFLRMTSKVDLNKCEFTKLTHSEYPEDWLLWATDNVEKAEEIVKRWVKDNPEPVYPTFWEVTEMLIGNHKELLDKDYDELMNERVPQDTAEQYGIAPLNLCNVNKYVSEWL